jgi:hypothetical protein
MLYAQAAENEQSSPELRSTQSQWRETPQFTSINQWRQRMQVSVVVESTHPPANVEPLDEEPAEDEPVEGEPAEDNDKPVLEHEQQSQGSSPEPDPPKSNERRKRRSLGHNAESSQASKTPMKKTEHRRPLKQRIRTLDPEPHLHNQDICQMVILAPSLQQSNCSEN